MKRSMKKVLLREIKGSFARFMSILIMVALGTLFLVGLRSAAPDMQVTADDYFDEQNLMDIQILSTLGLTETDIEEFSEVEGVETAEGGWSLDAMAQVAEESIVVKVVSLSEKSFNTPILVEGRMPQSPNECVVEEKIINTYGMQVGDLLRLDTEELFPDALTGESFVITGVVESPLYISLDRGTSTLGDGSISAYVLLPMDSFQLDYYTLCNLKATGAAELSAYSDTYQEMVDELTERLEPVAEDRADLRYITLYNDGQQAINDAQQELDDAKIEAETEIKDAETELVNARTELDDGWTDYDTGRETLIRGKADGHSELLYAEQELADAEIQLSDAKNELSDARTELDDGWIKLDNAKLQLQSSQVQLDAQREAVEAELAAAEAELNAQQALLDAQADQLDELEQQVAQFRAQVETYLAALEAQEEEVRRLLEQGIEIDEDDLPYHRDVYEEMVAQLTAMEQQLSSGKAALEAAREALSAAWEEYEAQKSAAEQALVSAQYTIDLGWGQYYESKTQLEQGEQNYADGIAQYEESMQDYQQGLVDFEQAKDDFPDEIRQGNLELLDAYGTLTDGEQAYSDGVSELNEAKQDLEERLQDGQIEIDDAAAKLNELEYPDVYVLDRNSNYGFVSYDQNAQRMENLAKMFPLIFYIVAALVCLTTMTRMVEEERTEIGSIKAMGYGTGAIAGRFLVYGMIASVLGGILGAIIGTLLIPWVIFTSYGIMYTIPKLHLQLYLPLTIGAIVTGTACTAAATLWAMHSTAKEVPAALMRPKAPTAGKKIMLERIPALWNRVGFSMKVCFRNLFRYKKRLFMTVIGISGCTSLMIAGFGLRSSIFGIIDNQYDDIYQYDLQLSLETEEANTIAHIHSALNAHENVVSSAGARVSAVTVQSPAKQDAYLFVVDDQEALAQQIRLRDIDSDEILQIPTDGVLINEKLAELLNVQAGDEIVVECGSMERVKVAGVVEHYVRHFIYMSAAQYEALFDVEYVPNEYLISVKDASDSAISSMSEALMEMDGVSTASNNSSVENNFRDTLKVIDTAVLIIILSAAALALVVLYNLTNINITERIRELATIKVLGFYDIEVAMYIYRENIILTVLGVLFGQFFGKYLCRFLVETVEMDIVMFGRTVQPADYLTATVLSLMFALIVNFLMYFRMKKIDMIQSLKSVE